MEIFKKEKLEKFIVYGFGQAINLLGPILVLPFLIQKCGVDKVGKIGVGMSIALIINGIIDYGSYINGVKEISINRENHDFLEKKLKSIYLSKIILFVVVSALIFVLINLISFLRQDKLLYLLSYTIVVGQLLNPAWFFQGVENFKWISIVNIISKTIYIVLVFLLISNKEDFVLANLFLGLGAIIANSIGVLWIFKQYSFSTQIIQFKEALIILKDECTFSISQVFLSIYQFFPIVIVNYLGGDLLAGQYRVIDQVVSVLKTYLNMFFYFVFTNICYEINISYKRGLNIWKQYNVTNFFFLSCLTFILFYFTTEILNFFNIKVVEFSDIVFNFRLALLIPLLTAISMPLRQLMFAFNLNKIYIRITIVTTIFNFILLFFFTKYEGLKGAFTSIILIELIIIILYAIILSKFKRLNKINEN